MLKPAHHYVHRDLKKYYESHESHKFFMNSIGNYNNYFIDEQGVEHFYTLAYLTKQSQEEMDRIGLDYVGYGSWSRAVPYSQSVKLTNSNNQWVTNG
jgi:hypothetical protein